MRPTPPSCDIKVLFIVGFGPVVRDIPASLDFYAQTLGLPLRTSSAARDYHHTETVEGAKTFALWPLSQAAQSCFGVSDWPPDIPFPQAWLEFDVEDIARSTAALRAQGYELLVAERLEPWGQTVTRMLSPEGLLLGITHTPSLR